MVRVTEKSLALIALWAIVAIGVLSSLGDGAPEVNCLDPTNENHTLCKYKTPARGCSLITKKLSRVDQLYILADHNKFRSRVACGKETQGSRGPQPGARDMTEITWDQDLADVAQAWANQCKIASDQNRNLDKYGYVGQNVYAYVESRTSANVDDPESAVNKPCGKAVTAWYSQVSRFNSSRVNPYTFDASTGQYSQMLWSNSLNVGCAFSQWTANGKVTGICVCNYGPGGNRRNGKVYTPATDESDICTACPDGTACDDSCLCIAPNPGQSLGEVTRNGRRTNLSGK